MFKIFQDIVGMSRTKLGLMLGALNIIAGAPNIFLKCQNCPCAIFAFVLGVRESGP